MILPGYIAFLFRKPQWTIAWSLVFANLAIFIYTELFFPKWPTSEVFKKIQDKSFATSVVEMYKQTIDPVEKQRWNSDPNISVVLRDHRFWKKVEGFPFKGDQIQIEQVRKNLLKFQKEYFQSSQFQLGLGPIEQNPWSWVTYQFTHASVFHLLGNIIVIFTLVSLIQHQVGLFWIISAYLFGGFGGGISYLLFEGSGSMAVVGASSSAFALMAFIVIVKRHELIPWSYLIAPVKSGYGVIYLPAFFLFPLFLMTDFISALWEPAGVSSSVALSAHIGGAAVGFVLGFAYNLEKQFIRHLIKTWNLDERQIAELDL